MPPVSAFFVVPATQDEYINRRRQGALLKSYRIISLERSGNTARATALLTFASIGAASSHEG
jgi:hypothetical protein